MVPAIAEEALAPTAKNLSPVSFVTAVLDTSVSLATTTSAEMREPMHLAGEPITVRVLYVFAGKQRQSDVGHHLRRMQEQNLIALNLLELDLLRSPDHDVLQADFWADTMQKVDSGHYNVVIMTPPCNTHSRARHSQSPGPKPLRSKRYPKGYPWLEGRQLATVQQANAFVSMTWDTCRRAHLAKAAFLVEHPEDLGATKDGELPASIWSEQDCWTVAEETMAETAAFFQCPFGANTSKPTRILTTLPLLAPDYPALTFNSWPIFSKQGGYRGPLPKRCGHRHKGLLGKQDPSGPFLTSAAAAYPPAMCKWIATMIVAFCKQPKVGEEQLPDKSIMEHHLTPIPALQDPPPKAFSQDSIGGKPDKKATPVIPPTAEEGEVTSEEDEPGIPKAKLRDHRPGYGHPVAVRWGGKVRDLHDGGGLCSPGRWHPALRKPSRWHHTQGLALSLKQLLRHELGDVDHLVMKMCCARHPEDPFSEDLLQKGRKVWASLLAKSSSFSEEELVNVQANQPFLLRLVGETLRE